MIPAEHAGHSGVWAHPADLTRVEDIEALVATTVTTLGGLEVLVIRAEAPRSAAPWPSTTLPGWLPPRSSSCR